MILVFLQSPYREDGAKTQFVGHFGQLTDAGVIPALKTFLLELSSVYDYGWLEVFSTVTKRWYHATLHFDDSYVQDSDRRVITLVDLKPGERGAENLAFFRNFTFE